MKTKRFLATVLALLMVLSCMSISAFATATQETVTCPVCNGNKTVENGTENCHVCSGSKTVTNTCPSCGGSGTVWGECPTCHGDSGVTFDCSTCGNEGYCSITCGTCSGSRQVSTNCTNCNATGSVPHYDTCPNCAGVGTVLNMTLDETEKSGEIDLNYTFTQTNETYTDTTKVKVTWVLTDLAATYTNAKTWDADQMKWVAAKEVNDIADSTASFTFVNYSSKAVNVKVEFAAETALASTLTSATFKNGSTDVTGTTVTVATPVTQATESYADSDFTAKAQTITATLVFDEDAFAALDAAASATKYGTYTVTIQ